MAIWACAVGATAAQELSRRSVLGAGVKTGDGELQVTQQVYDPRVTRHRTGPYEPALSAAVATWLSEQAGRR
jgi:hypothetical protein